MCPGLAREMGGKRRVGCGSEPGETFTEDGVVSCEIAGHPEWGELGACEGQEGGQCDRLI